MKIVSLAAAGTVAAAQEAADALARGNIVLYPTDTLYGLAVDATNPAALAALFALKGREEGKPVSVVIRDRKALEAHAELSDAAARLAERFLPGPLTLVLPAKEGALRQLVPKGLVGLRIPDDAFCRALSEAFGKPYTATSANVSGQPTRTAVANILAQLGASAERIALAIDDGPREVGIGSTVVEVIGDSVRVLREGAIPLAAISVNRKSPACT